LDEAVDVRSFPFEVAVGVIGGANIRVEEELTSIGVRPVFRDCEFGLSRFDGCDELFKGSIFAD
jgi:hypothetical protein